MDAKTYPLQDILKPERRYLIPTFQRDYEWNADDQWGLLFDDLEAAADRLLENTTELDGRAGREQPHFLGAIVCASLPFATGAVALRSVIDGQQRLTTAQLLIRGVLDVAVERGLDRSAASARRMLFNPSDVVDTDEERYKLWPRKRDREVWPIAMADETPAEGHHLYLQARRFFAEQARDYASTGQYGSPDDRVAALLSAVGSLFKLVVIDLDDNDDAQVIFEALNGRQTPLAAIDLVKNLLFMRGERHGDDVDALYERYWAHFDDEWWKEKVGSGHAQRGRRDVLLSVWLTAALGREANIGHLYREAREYLDGGPDTEVALRAIETYARAYRAVYAPPATDLPRLVVAYRRLIELNITSTIPLLVWLRSLPETHLRPVDHLRAVRAVESWALRRSYLGWQTRGYPTYLARVLVAAQHALRAGDDIADAVIAALKEGNLGWPSDADVKQAFLGQPFYRQARYRLRLLLGAIDAHLRNNDPSEPDATIDYDGLQVEHIMPRSWRQHWPVDAPDPGTPHSATDVTAREDARSAVIDRIGNLTLVTGSFNRSVSNSAWEVKRGEFQKQRSLVINYRVADSLHWDEAAIGARALELARAMTAIWPGPGELISGQPAS